MEGREAWGTARAKVLRQKGGGRSGWEWRCRASKPPGSLLICRIPPWWGRESPDLSTPPTVPAFCCTYIVILFACIYFAQTILC